MRCRQSCWGRRHERHRLIANKGALLCRLCGAFGVSTPLILGCLWVIASAVVAMLPMRRQMVPGLALLITAPGLLAWIGWVHGWIWLAVGLFAFVSMFRNPLIYFLRRALGRPSPLPKDMQE
ncbi:MAG: DUF2484 family protein [Tabrizicola sp.]|nr:DUF2484 family protein [Tabrizicola sp.]